MDEETFEMVWSGGKVVPTETVQMGLMLYGVRLWAFEL